MRIHEDFTRCSCGEALIKKEEYIIALYSTRPDMELFEPTGKRIIYRCKNCNKFIHEEILTED